MIRIFTHVKPGLTHRITPLVELKKAPQILDYRELSRSYLGT